MKKVLLVLFFTQNYLFAQVDQFKVIIDLNLGYTNYLFDEIINDGKYYSNVSYSGEVYLNETKHRVTKVYGINTILNVGLHIPFYKNEYLGFGITPKLGFGRLIQVFPNVDEIEHTSLPRIGCFSYNSEVSLYFLYDFNEFHSHDFAISISGGVKYNKLNEKYFSPIIGLDVIYKDWSFGYYTNIYQLKYYRQYSDGTIELAKRVKEFGFKIQYFIKTKKR